jgi:hypothetical protein
MPHRLILTLLTSLLLCTVSSTPLTSKIGGVNFIAEGFEGPFPYDAPESIASLTDARALGVNTVTLSFPYYTDSINSTAAPYPVAGGCPSGVPFNNASSPSDESIVTAIRAAHSLGLRVVLRPIIDPNWNMPNNRGTSRGRIGESFNHEEWTAWFVSYRLFLNKWALIATTEGVEIFCAGAELSATEKQDTEWRATLAAVRTVFSGTVYYSATGGDLTWWDASDFIAQDAYPALTNASVMPADVPINALVRAWNATLAQFHQMSVKYNRSVLLQETGVCSINIAGLFNRPWYWDCYNHAVNQDVQANYYESVFLAPYAMPWIAGVNFWKWAAQGGALDPSFFPLNKSAGQVMQKYLL